MNLGIVGHAQEKFTKETEAIARQIIKDEINLLQPDLIVSGHCPQGGVDIYAEEIAAELNIPKEIFAPTVNRWDGIGGFKERNIKIARTSSLVLCVVIHPSLLPPGVRDWGNGICYHCKDKNPKHIKSGGCWTAWRCNDRKWAIIESI